MKEDSTVIFSKQRLAALRRIRAGRRMRGLQNNVLSHYYLLMIDGTHVGTISQKYTFNELT